MPELAEVEYYRKQWDRGIGEKIHHVLTHENRIFRGSDLPQLRKALTGAVLQSSETHGKQMLFRFSKNAWLGLHLGMTGELRVEAANYESKKHDHLVLQQAKGSLVFNDARQFGRIRFSVSKDAPRWWNELPVSVLTKEFTLEHMRNFLMRHGKAPLKAVLLAQAGFPGVGNWMADEILWQAKVHPARKPNTLRATEIKKLHSSVRLVCSEAMRIVGKDWGDLPDTWLFNYRWKRGGHCPRDKAPLQHATIGARTTCWCPRCQKPRNDAA
ncbi:MAG: Fpg/Nei family DNA glycosylase [Limisphaerales bacterium]